MQREEAALEYEEGELKLELTGGDLTEKNVVRRSAMQEKLLYRREQMLGYKLENLLKRRQVYTPTRLHMSSCMIRISVLFRAGGDG